MSDVAAAVQAVAEVVDTAPAAAPVAPTVDPRLAEMAKTEKRLAQMRKEIASREEALKAKDSEYSTNYVPKSRLTEDPLSALAELGINTDKLTEMLLNAPNSNDPTVRALRAEINSIKVKQEMAEKMAAETQDKQYKQAVAQITAEAQSMIDTDPAFETIKAMGMHDAVTKLITDTFESKGHLLDVAEAAKQIEDYLIDEGFKMSQLSKVQAKAKPKTEETVVTPPAQKPPAQATKTLTNAVQSRSASQSDAAAQRARAIAAFLGKE